MESRHEILGNLSHEDVSASLRVCFLVDKQDYTEEEAYRFRECRALISQGKTYDEVATLFRERGLTVPEQPNSQEVLPKNKQRKGNSKPTTEAITELTSPPVLELKNISVLQLASLQIGKNISLAQAISILQVCGLSENSLHYSPQECESFLKACKLLSESSSLDLDFEPEINKILSALPEQNATLVGEIIRQKAKADASGAAQLYLKSLASEFGSPEFQQAWREMEAAVKARILGKFPKPTQYSPTIPLSPSPSTALPSASDNSSTTP